MINFLRRLFAKTPAVENQTAPYKIEPQVHSTDTVHDMVFVPPPVEQSKKPRKKAAAKPGSSKRKAPTKKS